jgi:hypothetical protein
MKKVKKVKIVPFEENSSMNINITKAKLKVPDWYKDSSIKMSGYENFTLMPENPSVTTSTYKRCSPFLDALTNGYIFYLGQDIEVTINNDGTPYIVWRGTYLNPISSHSKTQWDGLEYPDNCHDFVYKWQNHLTIKTPRNYSTLFTHPHNRFDLPFYTLSGVVDTDKYYAPVHFPFFLKNNFTGIIKAGTPLAQITFIKRDNWFKTIGKYNKDDIEKNDYRYFKILDRPYKNLFWQKKNYD